MKKEVKKTISRRTFMGAAASTAFAFNIVPSRVMGKDAPSNKLNIAGIGVGHQGWADLRNVQSENIVALCDVDLERAGGTIKKKPQAKVYRDFRVMFDEMEKAGSFDLRSSQTNRSGSQIQSRHTNGQPGSLFRAHSPVLRMDLGRRHRRCPPSPRLE